MHQKYVNDQASINKQVCSECLLGFWNFTSNFNGTIIIEDEIKNTNKKNFLALSGSSNIKISDPGVYQFILYINFKKSKSRALTVNLGEKVLYSFQNYGDVSDALSRTDAKSMGDFKFGKAGSYQGKKMKALDSLDVDSGASNLVTHVKCFNLEKEDYISLLFLGGKGSCEGFFKLQKLT